MKKYLIIIALSGILLKSNAQSKSVLDTIYANETKTVSLFFPNSIRQGIVGKSHFVFSYNKEQAQYFGLLQSTPGAESNLLLITSDGQVYSYILKYAKKLPKLNYFITKKESIGNENPISEDFKIEKKNLYVTDSIISDQLAMYKKTCGELMVKSKKKKLRSKRKNQITLSLNDILYRDNSIYFLIEIENKSVIDYDVNFLRFFISNRSSTKNRSSQTLLKNPIYTYLLPDKVKGNSKREFIVVISKFTIDYHKKMIVELNELYGERNIELKVAGRLIVNSN